MPIGGLKEKTMAAYKYGMKTVIIPKENLPDLDEIDPKVRESLDFVAVERIEEALPIAFADDGYIKKTENRKRKHFSETKRATSEPPILREEEKMNFNNAVFEMSGGLARQLPNRPSRGCFFGKVKCGKSSLLNKIL